MYCTTLDGYTLTVVVYSYYCRVCRYTRALGRVGKLGEGTGRGEKGGERWEIGEGEGEGGNGSRLKAEG